MAIGSSIVFSSCSEEPFYRYVKDNNIDKSPIPAITPSRITQSFHGHAGPRARLATPPISAIRVTQRIFINSV